MQVSITTQSIQFSSDNSHLYNAYLASPVQPSPQQDTGIILLHDCWGMSQHSHEIAENFSRYGCTVLLPDLYDQTPPTTQAQADEMMYQLDWHQAAEHVVNGAARYLMTRCTRVCVVGLSMGSGIAIMSATLNTLINKYACFYGLPELVALPVERISSPVQGHFVESEENDLWCPPDRVQTFIDSMAEHNKQLEIHWYKDAMHGFMNHRKTAMYCAQACKLATARTLKFLNAT